jgi:hypothetical protein
MIGALIKTKNEARLLVGLACFKATSYFSSDLFCSLTHKVKLLSVVYADDKAIELTEDGRVSSPFA